MWNKGIGSLYNMRMGYQNRGAKLKRVILLSISMIVAFRLSYAQEKRFVTDGEMIYISKLKYAEIKFSVARSLYLVGNTIPISIEIKCRTDQKLLAFDPKHNKLNASISPEDRSIAGEVGILYDRDDYGVPLLRILKKNDSVKYLAKVAVNPDALDSLEVQKTYKINLIVRYWIYSDRLLRWTYNKNDPRNQITNPNGRSAFVDNSRLEYSIPFEIGIYRNFDKLWLER
jgi:hypothetical protein